MSTHLAFLSRGCIPCNLKLGLNRRHQAFRGGAVQIDFACVLLELSDASLKGSLLRSWSVGSQVHRAGFQQGLLRGFGWRFAAEEVLLRGTLLWVVAQKGIARLCLFQDWPSKAALSIRLRSLLQRKPLGAALRLRSFCLRRFRSDCLRLETLPSPRCPPPAQKLHAASWKAAKEGTLQSLKNGRKPPASRQRRRRSASVKGGLSAKPRKNLCCAGPRLCASKICRAAF